MNVSIRHTYILLKRWWRLIWSNHKKRVPWLALFMVDWICNWNFVLEIFTQIGDLNSVLDERKKKMWSKSGIKWDRKTAKLLIYLPWCYFSIPLHNNLCGCRALIELLNVIHQQFFSCLFARPHESKRERERGMYIHELNWSET